MVVGNMLVFQPVPEVSSTNHIIAHINVTVATASANGRSLNEPIAGARWGV